MLINSQNLDIVFTAFNAGFQGGLGQAESQWSRVATMVPSSTEKETYGWLGKLPNVREWVGDRHVHKAAAHDYTIKNIDWEQTIEVSRNSIEDDSYGIYAPLFTEMGEATAAHVDLKVFGLLKTGFTEVGYDGQPFFDTDHPVLDANGVEQSVSNTGGGASTPWFLIDDSRALKPILYQSRKMFDMVRKDRPEDDNVFNRNSLLYGTHGRMNVGFGFWQFAYGSQQTLDEAAYAVARQTMLEMKGDGGRPLGIRPKLLVVPPALEKAGLQILNAESDAAGATNVWMGTAQLLVVPWLA